MTAAVVVAYGWTLAAVYAVDAWLLRRRFRPPERPDEQYNAVTCGNAPFFPDTPTGRTSTYLCFSLPDKPLTWGDAVWSRPVRVLSKFARSEFAACSRPDLTRNVRFSPAVPSVRRILPDRTRTLR